MVVLDNLFIFATEIIEGECEMTIITGSQFRANQGKYVEMAHRGEHVYLKTRKGNVVLTPVPDNIEDEEAAFQKYVNSSSFLSIATQIRKEYKEGKGVTLSTPEEIEAYLDSL